MSQKKEDTRHTANHLSSGEMLSKACAVITVDGKNSNVPSQHQRKEDAEKALYLDRI